MGLDFKIRDFAYPLEILRLKRQFDKNQWLDTSELRALQLKKLREILVHADEHVPYYRELFKASGFSPRKIECPEDMRTLPFTDKTTVSRYFSSLIADHPEKFKPQLLHTSGTTGGQIQFYVDAFSSVLEFVYYWRFWGWHGYKLGDRFAEMSAQFFTPIQANKDRYHQFQPLIQRVMINSMLLAPQHAREYVRVFRQFRPKFLKGLPSNLYALALVLRECPNHGISLNAIFSQGENLLKYQKDLLERVFSCKVFDSYGHMERTVAISQCPQGSYHVHSDYGFMELVDAPGVLTDNAGDEEAVAGVVGTSLYNFAMPLIRYKTGDYVKVRRSPVACSCGRTFPTVQAVLGRDTDIVITPEGRMLSALYVALDRTPGILHGQVIQDAPDHLSVRVVYDGLTGITLDEQLTRNLRDFVGDTMRIDIVRVGQEAFGQREAKKQKVVISCMDLTKA